MQRESFLFEVVTKKHAPNAAELYYLILLDFKYVQLKIFGLARSPFEIASVLHVRTAHLCKVPNVYYLEFLMS